MGESTSKGKCRWLTIDTVPEDGTPFLACDEEVDRQVIVMAVIDGEFGISLGNGSIIPIEGQPTHWMPLPLSKYEEIYGVSEYTTMN